MEILLQLTHQYSTYSCKSYNKMVIVVHKHHTYLPDLLVCAASTSLGTTPLSMIVVGLVDVPEFCLPGELVNLDTSSEPGD